MTELRYRDGRVCRTDRTADELVTDMHAAAASIVRRLDSAKAELWAVRSSNRIFFWPWAAFFMCLGYLWGVSS